MLILLFSYFTYSICNDQVVRFLNGPIIVSLEKNYRDWAHEPMAITICTDYVDESVADNLYRRLANNGNGSKTENYDVYRRFFHAVGTLNAENIQSMEEFENMSVFTNLNGDDIFGIAIEASR